MSTAKINVEFTDAKKSAALYNFRHASELQNEAKGGYLEGSITFQNLVGSGEVIKSIELDLVENQNGDVHPNVLHVNRATRKPRFVKGENPKRRNIQAQDCFLKLDFVGNQEACVKTSYLKENISVPDVWDPSTCTLKLGNKGLRLTIVKPSQKGKCTNPEEMFMKNVLNYKDKKIKEDNPTSFNIDEKMQRFSSKRKQKTEAAKGSIFKVYLRVLVRLENGDFDRTISDEPIFDKGKYNFEVDSIFPDIICTRGKHCITVLLNNSKMTNDIGVDFRLKDQTTVMDPLSAERKAAFFRLYFEAPNQELRSNNLMLEANVTVGDSQVPLCLMEQNIEIRRHEDGCVPCALSKKKWDLKFKESKSNKRNMENTAATNPKKPRQQAQTEQTQPDTIVLDETVNLMNNLETFADDNRGHATFEDGPNNNDGSTEANDSTIMGTDVQFFQTIPTQDENAENPTNPIQGEPVQTSQELNNLNIDAGMRTSPTHDLNLKDMWVASLADLCIDELEEYVFGNSQSESQSQSGFSSELG